jgi:hypothetical protein
LLKELISSRAAAALPSTTILGTRSVITINRSLARQLRAVYRRAGIKATVPGYRLEFRTGPDGLCAQIAQNSVAIRFQQPHAVTAEEIPAEEIAAEEIIVAGDLLADCEGRSDDPVQLELQGKSSKTVRATWTDGRVPQVGCYDAVPRNKTLFPELPAEFATVEAGLWQALRDATKSTDRESARFALGCVQLKASTGQILATDGRQALIQSGFQFPWSDDLLIPGNNIFACRELESAGPLSVGRTADWIALRRGNWTVMLKIEKDARFPKLDDVLPDAATLTSRLKIVPTDAEFLRKVLPKLPRDDAQHEAITLDLNGQVFIRAKPSGESRATELLLANSQFTGDPILVNIDRRYLASALQLGFEEIAVKDPASIVVCSDGRRQYVWMPLSTEGSVCASDNAIRITSPIPGSAPIPIPHRKKRSRSTMPQSKVTTTDSTPGATEITPAGSQPERATEEVTGNKVHGPKPRKPTLKPSRPNHAPPLEQAIALRDSLRRQAAQAGDLVRAIKRQRRDAQLLKSTLASLKQLQAAG